MASAVWPVPLQPVLPLKVPRFPVVCAVQKVLWIMNLCGAMANVLLNLALIPRWGSLGAAAASIVTQFISNVVMNSMLPETRGCNRLMLMGLDPRRLGHLVGMLRRKK